MNGNELMCGDWVLHNGRVKSIGSIITSYIADVYDYENNLCVGSTQCMVEDLSPIPLTEEILENSGFETYLCYYYIQGAIDLIKSEKKDGVWYCGKTYRTSRGELEFTDFCEIKYVHELQHALHLVGVNREIMI